uniref:Uncharacterized protein n=1 Tax=Rhizophora mucronata TaxID=61149 RepID=A0A2P2PRL7_RHIMU
MSGIDFWGSFILEFWVQFSLIKLCYWLFVAFLKPSEIRILFSST